MGEGKRKVDKIHCYVLIDGINRYKNKTKKTPDTPHSKRPSKKKGIKDV